MLPRSLLFIIVVSCWFQINAVPFHPRDDYQISREDGDVMDYAFPDDESSEEESSILDTISDTMDTIHVLSALQNKSNINVNANQPRSKKTSKKSKQSGHKHKPKYHYKKGHKQKLHDNHLNNGTINHDNSSNSNENDIERRSIQDISSEIAKDVEKIAVEKSELSKIKLQNHCANARRSNLTNYSQTINMNSSYLDIDEDYTIDGEAKVKKTHTIFTDDYITLCWIETTTIKYDKSHNPPKRLILREATISYENAAAIPEEYLSCPIIDGDISRESNEALCNTSFTEAILDDTRISRTVNMTKFTREKNIDVHTNKLIKCTMGSVITKDVYEWLNDTNSTRQRIEIKVSPQIYKTEEICPYYSVNENNSSIDNQTPECSDENESNEYEDEKESSANITKCFGDNCPDGQINHLPTVTTILPELNVLLTKKPSVAFETNDELSTGFTRDSLATERPELQSPKDKDVESPGKIPVVGETIDNAPEKNITTSSEESCEEGDCDSTESLNENISDNKVKKNVTEIDDTAKISDLAKKEKTKLYIPEPFICPVENKKVCAHLERVAKLQSLEHSSDENIVESEEESTVNETLSNNEDIDEEYKEIEVENVVRPLTNMPTASPGNRRSTIILSKLPNAQSIEISTQSSVLKTIDGLNGQESEQNLSSENSEELNSETNVEVDEETLNKDKFVESSSMKSPMIYINYTQKIEENSSEESNILSKDMIDNILLHNMELNESCDDSKNCHQSNLSSYTPRMSSPSVNIPNQIISVNQDEVEKKKEITEEDSGSCDCDEDSAESKKCDPKLGSCSSEIHHKHDNKISTQSMAFDDNDVTKTHQSKNKSVAVDEQKTTVPMTIDREKSNDANDNNETIRNHKLSLKIHVSLEHIDENKENHELAQVEKHITLNELPEQHGNHSLYWQIQSLNKSANDINSLKDIFNCSILEKLAEDAIIDRLNMTNLESEISNSDDSYRRRKRRNVDDITKTINGISNNSSMIGSSIKECILPNIREDVKNGLTDMISELSNALNDSRNSGTEKSNVDSTTMSTMMTNNNIATTESPKNSTVANRNRRSLMNNNGGDDVEEISRWSKERIIPSIYGGQLRSVTELKILRDPPGL